MHTDPLEGDAVVLRALVAVSADGLAVLDDAGRFVVVTEAAARVLGSRPADLVGRPAPFGPSGGPGQDDEARDDRVRVDWIDPAGRRRVVEYRASGIPGGGRAVWFCDVTDVLRQRERLTAIARAAATVAGEGSLRGTLDAVAREVVMTTNIVAVHILALTDPHEDLRLLGMAGFGEAADFAERMNASRRLGARIRFMEAIQQARPVVVPHRKAAVLADPAWAPLHEIMDRPDWDGFVSVPLRVRGRTLGVINAFYTPGEEFGPDCVSFLEAMADQAAVAIDSAEMLAASRSAAQLDERRRLARDLHDSVAQQLFSMRMQARALRAQVDGGNTDPVQLGRGAQELADLSGSALADLRGLVFELRPLDLLERGLVDAVRVHAAGLEARTGLVVDVREVDPLPTATAEVQEDVYRIVQEALHNVVKHAAADTVQVCFAAGPDDGLVVEVFDDGAAGPATPGTDRGERLGLVSMRERAERWGGRLDAGPRDGAGWSVRLQLPPSGGPA